MANSVIFAGEKAGGRIFKFGRLGYTNPGDDLGANTYTSKIKTERVYPAGPGALINFRRVVIHFFGSGPYEFVVKVWVDGVQTTLGDGTAQEVTITGNINTTSEISEEIEIAATGSNIQMEIAMDSDTMIGVFLLEQITARGRVIRQSSTRTGVTS